MAKKFGQSFRDAIAQIKIDTPQVTVPAIKIPEITVPEAKVTVNIPEIKLPTINVPEPKVTVNVPEVKIPPFPEIKMPDSMEIHGEVGLFGYGFNNPLPVQLRDAEGNPVSLPEMMSVASGGGGPRFVKINNTSSEPIPISGNITSTPGATYYASDAIGSVNIVQSIPIDVTVIGATGTIGVVTINPDGNPVYGGSSSGGGLTDAELRASSIDVQQASGASWSTNVLSMPSVTVTSVTNSIATSILGGDGQTVDPRNRTWTITETVNVTAPNSMDVQQASGASWSTNVLSMPAVTVTSITNSTQSALVDSTGVQYSGSNPVPVSVQRALESIGLDVMTVRQVSGASHSVNVLSIPSVTVTSITNSTASALVDSSGVQYSGSNPVPTKEIKPATGTNSSVADNAVSTTILASNTARIGATVYNDSSATLYLLLGSTAASTTNYTCKVVSSGYYEVPFGYTGQLTGIWASDPGDGAARVTEIT